MNIEDFAQPPKSAEEQAEADRKLTETLNQAVRRYAGTSFPKFSDRVLEPARDHGAERMRTLLEEARKEGVLEGFGIALALFKRVGQREALESLEKMIEDLEVGDKG
ncbi:hypothetical protein [Massilia sp. NP310]|uniref:hypothetical protein n=1 Tax=Massilia sp. NP310 TaxID=2861282 RepID=UPI001C637FAB|nr:hypothetical protein [Massilia sp. NP310]QYG03903.1 hypothetical protein KY496_11235 [Massilia sp. NP310]